MKIIIECTNKEKEEILNEKCYFDIVFYSDDICLSMNTNDECEKCYNNHNIEFKIIENKD